MRSILSVAFALIMLAAPVGAQILGGGGPIKGLLGRASDSALDKLAKPGAFAADDTIRIALPGPAKGLSSVMKLAGQAGIGGDISGSLNDAAGQAASAAKPIFRAAIDNMSAKDMVSLGTGGSTAATQYLHKSAGDSIKAELAPLVRAALSKTGVLDQSAKLSGLGLNPDSLTDYVAQKTTDGIFTYLGREEAKLRSNPMSLIPR